MEIGERDTRITKNGSYHLLLVYYYGKIPYSAKVLEKNNFCYNKKSMLKSSGWMILTR